MPIHVALDPQLDLSAAEFVAAWNASEHGADAPATTEEPVTESFMPPEMAVALIAAAASVPTTIIATFVSEYLKKKFIDGDDPKVTVTTISTPDGEPLYVVTRREE